MPSYQGALNKSDGLENGPDKIISHYKKRYGEKSLLDFDILRIGSFKDIKIQYINNYNILLKKVKKGDIFLGGDHSITYPIFKAIKKRHKNCGLLVFDCHADMHVLFDFASHQDWIYYLVHDKIISGKDIMVFGLRELSGQEKKFALDNKINLISYGNDIYKMMGKVLNFCKRYDNVYVSFDIDVISPRYAPGTGYTKKGGITPLFAYKILSELKGKANIIGFDLVEVNPKLDKKNKTLDLASSIVNLMIK